MNTIFVWPLSAKGRETKPGTSGGGASIWPEGLSQSRWAAAPSCLPAASQSWGLPPGAFSPWKQQWPSPLYRKIKHI